MNFESIRQMYDTYSLFLCSIELIETYLLSFTKTLCMIGRYIEN